MKIPGFKMHWHVSPPPVLLRAARCVPDSGSGTGGRPPAAVPLLHRCGRRDPAQSVRAGAHSAAARHPAQQRLDRHRARTHPPAGRHRRRHRRRSETTGQSDDIPGSQQVTVGLQRLQVSPMISRDYSWSPWAVRDYRSVR